MFYLFTSDFSESQNNKKKYVQKHFSKKMKENLTQIRPTKTNREVFDKKWY